MMPDAGQADARRLAQLRRDGVLVEDGTAEALELGATIVTTLAPQAPGQHASKRLGQHQRWGHAESITSTVAALLPTAGADAGADADVGPAAKVGGSGVDGAGRGEDCCCDRACACSTSRQEEWVVSTVVRHVLDDHVNWFWANQDADLASMGRAMYPNINEASKSAAAYRAVVRYMEGSDVCAPLTPPGRVVAAQHGCFWCGG